MPKPKAKVVNVMARRRDSLSRMDSGNNEAISYTGEERKKSKEVSAFVYRPPITVAEVVAIRRGGWHFLALSLPCFRSLTQKGWKHGESETQG